MAAEDTQDNAPQKWWAIHSSPIGRARICVEEIGLGIRSTICALLHDTVEDTDINLDDVEREFGNEIARIVDGLTKYPP